MSRLNVSQTVALACLWEAAIPKPGNVHRGADFCDLTVFDFVTSAIAVSPVFDRANELSVGELILQSIDATQQLVGENTNLGLVLLLAPLAKAAADSGKVDGGQISRDNVTVVLRELTPLDAELTYRAIRKSGASALGTVQRADVFQHECTDLVGAMTLSRSQDLIAEQYANGFEQVFDCVVPWISSPLQVGYDIPTSVVQAHVRLMKEFPDSLIARKCGRETAVLASRMAAQVLSAGSPGEDDYERELGNLDFWLRADHNRRNPGTSADMIGAGLFVAIWNNEIAAPFAFQKLNYV